jgi:hypothetical protein
MKRILSGIQILLCFFLLNSCGKDDDSATSPVVINELMSSNSTTAADQNGEYDDWVELYNTSATAVDLSGYYLTDNNEKLNKWQFPAGTIINGNGYLIIWADKDEDQTGLHANFKLSAEGEELLLINSDSKIIDKVTYGVQTLELAYARKPNGTGSFAWETPTFNGDNGE